MGILREETGDAAERVLFVHAHPDDESITTGGTIATLVDRGAWVTVVTCTRGELGEVIPPELQVPLDADDALADYREGELREALRILGVSDHRYLGSAEARWEGREPRRYLDSGMAWGPNGAVALARRDPGSLTTADFGEVAADIAAVVADIRPTVIVSYDDFGGYGHPDHIRAAQAARRAAEVYDIPYFAIEPAPSSPTPAEFAPTMVVDIAPVMDRKKAALAAHRTQAIVHGDSFELSNGVDQKLDSVESFRRIRREYPQGPTPFAEQGVGVKALSTVIALAVGLCVGALLTVLHQTTIAIGDVAFPVGLIASIAIVIALLVGMRLVFGTRLVVGAAALGVMVMVGVLSLTSQGGSILIPGNSNGYVWAFAPTVIALFIVGWPQVRARPRGKLESPSEVKGSLPK